MRQSTTPDYTSFAKAIVALRKAAGMTGTEVAKRAHFSLPYLSDMENHQRPPPPKATRTRLYKAMRLDKAQRADLEALCAKERCAHCDAVRR